MKQTIAMKIALLALLIAGLAATVACGDVVRGGAEVVLEGISIGQIAMEGKPLTGLPSQTVNVRLKVSSNELRVNTSGGKTTIKLNPSGATVVIAPDGTTFTGVKAEQVVMEWPTGSTTK